MSRFLGYNWANSDSLHVSGDSGGPTYVMRNGKQVLVSLISYGPSTCQRGVQGISYNSDIFKEMAHVKNLIKTCAAQVGLKNLEI